MKALTGMLKLDETTGNLLFFIDNEVCIIKQEDYGYMLESSNGEILFDNYELIKLRTKLDHEALRYIIRASIVNLITFKLKNKPIGINYRFDEDDIDCLEDYIELQAISMIHLDNSNNNEVSNRLKTMDSRILCDTNNFRIILFDRKLIAIPNSSARSRNISILPSHLIEFIDYKGDLNPQLADLIDVMELYKEFGLNIYHML